MKKSFSVFSILVISFVLSAYAFSADNWPTWRGIDFNALSADGNPPVKWSENENIKWKVPVEGDGSDASPIVWGDRIYYQAAVKVESDNVQAEPDPQPQQPRRRGGPAPKDPYKFVLVCLDRSTGKTLWTKTAIEIVPHERHHNDHGFNSYSPVTDGKYIWANFGSRGMYCFDMDGNRLWKQELGKYTIRASFGEGGSPCIAGDNVIVLKDHEGDSEIFAFNKITGKLAWKKTRDEGTSWTTPVPVKVNGKWQVVVNGTNQIRSYDSKNGDIIWTCTGQTTNVIPAPVYADGVIYCTSGYRGAKLQAIKLDAAGDLTGTDAVLWEVSKATPYVPSPILYQDRVYVFSGFKEILSCYNAKTGTPLFQEQKLDEMKGVYASPVAVAGRVYFIGRNGVTYVLNSSDKLEVLSVNKLDDDIDCSPAIVGDEIIIKGTKNIYCIN